MTITTTLTNFPEAPSRNDPTNFRTEADAWVNHLTNTAVSEINDVIDEMNSTAVDVNTDAAIAAQAKTYVQATVGAAWWASGTTYASGDGAIGSNGYTYISLVGANVGNDPTTDDGTNWQRVSGPFPGGVESQSSAVDIALLATDSRIQSVTITTYGKKVSLPDATNLIVGLEFVVINAGAFDFYLVDYDDNKLCIVPSGEMANCFLLSTSTSAGDWKFAQSSADDKILEASANAFTTDVFTRQAIVNIDDSTILCVYKKSSDGSLYAAAFSASTGTLLDGPDKLTTGKTIRDYDLSGTKISATAAFFVYANDTDNTVNGVVLSYSGGVLTVTGPTVLESHDSTARASCAALSSSKIAVVFWDGTTTHLRALVADWNGSSISVYAGPTDINSLTYSSQHSCCYAVNSTNFLAFVRTATSTLTLYSVNLSGTTISVTDTQAVTTSGNVPSLSKIKDDGTYIWYALPFQNSTSSLYDIAIARLTKADNSLDLSSAELISATIDTSLSVLESCFCIDDRIIVLCYSQNPYAATDRRICVCLYEFDSSAPSVTKLGEYIIYDYSGLPVVAPIGADEGIVVFADSGASTYGVSIRFKVIA